MKTTKTRIIITAAIAAVSMAAFTGCSGTYSIDEKTGAVNITPAEASNEKQAAPAGDTKVKEEISVESSSAAESKAKDNNVSKAEDNSEPAQSSAPAQAAAPVKNDAPVQTAAPVESAPETISAPEEKKETQPVEMNAEKLFSMTNSELRALSNNDFKAVLEPYYFTLTYGIRCNAFPNYVYLVEYRNEEGKPSGSLEVPDRWHGDEKIVLDSESVYGLIVQGDEPIGEGVSIGMTYSQIKNVQGKIMMGYSGLAYTLINGKVWTLHFLLSTDEQKILDEKISELTEGNGGLYYTTKIDLTELGLDPVCHAAYIYNTDNGLRPGESASEIIESLKQ